MYKLYKNLYKAKIIILINLYNNSHKIIKCHPKLILTKSELVTIYLISVNIKVFGGEPGPAATLAPKLGPLGLNAKKVG